MTEAAVPEGFVEDEEFTVVGVDCPSPPLIIYGWARLAAQRSAIHDIVEPAHAYAVWHATTGTGGEPASACLLGFRVQGRTQAPEGLTSVTVPACRFAEFRHLGHIGLIGQTYDRIHAWFRNGPPRPEGVCPGIGAIEIYDTNRTIAEDYTFTIREPVGPAAPTIPP